MIVTVDVAERQNGKGVEVLGACDCDGTSRTGEEVEA